MPNWSKLKNLSFHPKFAAALDATLSGVMVWWLTILPNWWYMLVWFAFRLVLWLLLVRVVYYPPEASRRRHFLTLGIFGLGLILFLLFMEWPWTWYFFSFIFIVCPAVSFWLLPTKEGMLSFAGKPHRRWLFFMDVLGLAGVWTGLGAIWSFQLFSGITKWPYLIFGTLLTSLVSQAWWLEYRLEKNRRFWQALALLSLIVLQLSWIVFLWPIGYLVAGLFITWLWYLAWLILRFHLSPEGIVWRKQLPFLIINIILIAVYLSWFVRWK